MLEFFKNVKWDKLLFFSFIQTHESDEKKILNINDHSQFPLSHTESNAHFFLSALTLADLTGQKIQIASLINFL